MEAQEKTFCQSCGMPLTDEYLGTNADGSKNGEYCVYCFKDGGFAQDVTMDGMIDHCLAYLDEFNAACDQKLTKEEAREEMRKYFPTLERWKS